MALNGTDSIPEFPARVARSSWRASEEPWLGWLPVSRDWSRVSGNEGDGQGTTAEVTCLRWGGGSRGREEADSGCA